MSNVSTGPAVIQPVGNQDMHTKNTTVTGDSGVFAALLQMLGTSPGLLATQPQPTSSGAKASGSLSAKTIDTSTSHQQKHMSITAWLESSADGAMPGSLSPKTPQGTASQASPTAAVVATVMRNHRVLASKNKAEQGASTNDAQGASATLNHPKPRATSQSAPAVLTEKTLLNRLKQDLPDLSVGKDPVVTVKNATSQTETKSGLTTQTKPTIGISAGQFPTDALTSSLLAGLKKLHSSNLTKYSGNISTLSPATGKVKLTTTAGASGGTETYVSSTDVKFDTQAVSLKAVGPTDMTTVSGQQTKLASRARSGVQPTAVMSAQQSAHTVATMASGRHQSSMIQGLAQSDFGQTRSVEQVAPQPSAQPPTESVVPTVRSEPSSKGQGPSATIQNHVAKSVNTATANIGTGQTSWLQPQTQASTTNGTGQPALNLQANNTYEQFGQLVQQQVQNQVQTLNVQVHPQGLGSITVAVTHQAQGLSVQLTASNPATAAWLQQDSRQLLQAVQNAGIQVSSVQVGFGQQQGDTSGQRKSNKGKDESAPFRTGVSGVRESGGRTLPAYGELPDGQYTISLQA